ncbi:hypothetical protein D3C84_1003010 [compost metagenome]
MLGELELKRCPDTVEHLELERGVRYVSPCGKCADPVNNRFVMRSDGCIDAAVETGTNEPFEIRIHVSPFRIGDACRLFVGAFYKADVYITGGKGA